MDNRIAAAQLATLLLLVVGVLLALEARAQKRLRFTTAARWGAEAQPVRLRGAARAGLGGLRLAGAAGLRAAARVHAAAAGGGLVRAALGPLPAMVFNSLRLGAISARWPCWSPCCWPTGCGAPRAGSRAAWCSWRGWAAVPGAVLVVGLLLPVGWLQQAWPQSGVGYWMTATILGIVWAYLVRFVSVALQSVQSGYARIPGSVDDSARMLGTSGAALLTRVHWPLLKRSPPPAACAWCSST